MVDRSTPIHIFGFSSKPLLTFIAVKEEIAQTLLVSSNFSIFLGKVCTTNYMYSKILLMGY